MSDQKTVLIVACEPSDDLVIRIYLDILEQEGIAVPGAGIIQVNYLALNGGGAEPDAFQRIQEQCPSADYIVLFAHRLCGAFDEEDDPMAQLIATATEIIHSGADVTAVWIDELDGSVVTMKPEVINVVHLTYDICLN